jgi:hypothetical protein
MNPCHRFGLQISCFGHSIEVFLGGLGIKEIRARAPLPLGPCTRSLLS